MYWMFQKFISFRNLISRPVPVQMISNFNNMRTKNLESYIYSLNTFSFYSEWPLYIWKDKAFKHYTYIFLVIYTHARKHLRWFQ